MGLAAIFVGGLIALGIAVAIVYGTFVGLARAGRFLWRLLVPEAAGQRRLAEAHASEPSCWEDKGCPDSVKATCPAYLQKDGLPCWLAKLRTQGRLPVDCLTCNRFSVADLVA